MRPEALLVGVVAVLSHLNYADGFLVAPAWSPVKAGALRGLHRAGPPAIRRVHTSHAPQMNVARAAVIPGMQTVAENMEQIGATYCILWKQQGDRWVVNKDYTTEARRKAMRKVRGDDKLFASESRKYSVPLSGRGPVAVAARTGKQVTITDTSSMVRAELAKEFGIRKIYFVPIQAGVLEYGTPSGEEVVLLNLMSLTISEMSHPGSPGRFFKLLGELFLCLRLLIAIEENNLVAGVRKTVSSFLTSVIDLDQKIKKGQTKRGGSIFSRLAVFGIRAIMTVLSPIVWALRWSQGSTGSWWCWHKGPKCGIFDDRHIC